MTPVLNAPLAAHFAPRWVAVMRYEERHKLFAGKVIISYPGSWGGQIADRWMWMGELNGEVWDYHTREHLISDAIANGLDFVVLRVHKNGDATQLRVQPTGGMRRKLGMSVIAPCG